MKLNTKSFEYILFSCLLLISFTCKQNSIQYEKGAVSPGGAVGTFEIEPGFKIELIAAEPLIADAVHNKICGIFR